MATDHLRAPEAAEYFTMPAAETERLRTIGYWGASVVALAAYFGILAWVLSSNTAKIYGFPVAHDLRTLIEIALQIGPILAALFMVLLLPVKDRVIAYLLTRARPVGRIVATVGVSLAAAIITVSATAAVVLAVCEFRPGAISPVTVLWVASELVFDLTLIGIFTTLLYALTRRLWAAIFLFICYISAVLNAGPAYGITSYIGFGSTVPVMLTTYSTAPLYDGAAWLLRGYWTCITLLMLSMLYAFDCPPRPLLSTMLDNLRGRDTKPRSAWYPIVGLCLLCIAVCAALVKLQSYGVAKYQSPSAAALAAATGGGTDAARLELTHFDVRMNYAPDRKQVAVQGALSFRNGGQPADTAYFQMPALMVADQLQILGAGEYQVTPLGKYIQIQFAKPLPPLREAQILYRGLIRPAGAFDLAVQGKVLDGAFFLTDADVLLTARSAACLASAMATCGRNENYLMSDRATGRITVVAPEPFRVASAGQEATRELGRGAREHVFTIGTPRLATFLVACAPFRVSTAVSAKNGVNIRVLRSPAMMADGGLEAPLAEKILSFYETAWPAYPRQHLDVIEMPTPLGEAMAFDGTVAISDKIIASRSPLSGTVSNLLEFVMAHEIAHQWWGFGVVPSKLPGRQFVIEAIPQFAAYKFLGQRGILSEQAAQRNEERRYRAASARMGNRESSLARSEAGDEVAYNKGPFVLLSLDHLGGGALMDRLGALNRSYSYVSHGQTLPDELVAGLIAELPDGDKETARNFLYNAGVPPARQQ